MSAQPTIQTTPTNDLKTTLEDRIPMIEDIAIDFLPKEAETESLGKTRNKGPFLVGLSFALFGYFLCIFLALEIMDFYDLGSLSLIGPS